MVVLELGEFASVETLFLRIGGLPGGFWFDDTTVAPVDGGFMGCLPTVQLRVTATGILEERYGSDDPWKPRRDDPVEAIGSFLGRTHGPPLSPGAFPRVAGFLGYDLADRIEPRAHPRRVGGLGFPIAHLARYDAAIRWRRTEGAASEVVRAEIISDSAHAARAIQQAVERRAEPAARPGVAAGSSGSMVGSGVLEEAATARGYVESVQRALEYIREGEVYQVNLAHRMLVTSPTPPAELHLALRSRQAVPRSVFLHLDGVAVLCASPERFVRLRGGELSTEPIKGTRPRRTAPAEDAAEIESLRADVKERAEHVMIVDLERNDLGRICRPGSVRVASLMRVESFATLHHLVSTVQGRLRPGVGMAEVIRAVFPGGSVTGAPKIRAIQVIADLEATPREVYTGAVVWSRGAGDLDSAIAIRTAIAQPSPAGWRYAQHVGAGIVADSDPDREYAETWLKARPFLEAVLGAEAARAAAAAATSSMASDPP